MRSENIDTSIGTPAKVIKRPGRCLRCLVGSVSIVLVLSACGVRETTAPDGTTNREFFVGMLPQIDCTAQASHSAQQTQLGLWASGKNAGAGFQSARYFCGGPDCQITIWADDLKRSEVEEIARTYSGVCFANWEGEI